MKKLCLFITGLILCFGMFAQPANRGSISVKIVSSQSASLENVTVELRKAKDSALVKTAITDKNGLAEFENILYGNYWAKVIMVGYTTTSSSPITLSAELNKVRVQDIAMQTAATELGNVTVTGRKPFIQKLTDRIVVNVDNSIVNAGSSAMEVLERSPGVNIDPNDVISLRGKAGVIIMIDGKPTAMSGADLANYLRGLPSAAIDRIEIITNPSAKYDAAGNSGIIDIKMKKDQRLGTNGTFTTGYGQGVYPKANVGTTFNYRNKKVNIFGNYNYAYRVGLNHLILDRNFYNLGVYNGGDLKDNYSKSPFNTHSSRLGMDFFPNKKTTLGFLVSGNFNHFRRNNNNSSTVINPQKQPTSTFESLATNNDHGNNVVANINFKHTFDKTGKELTADLDYGVYNSGSLTVNSTKYYKLDGTQLQPDYTLNGDQDGKLTFKTGKIDYTNPMKKGAKFEAGAKFSFVSSDNDAKFFDVSSGTPVNDVNKTNHFIYHENNQAGYVNFSKEFKKFSIQAGLRGENTSLRTEQKIGNAKFDSSYFQLFPSAFFNYKIKEDKTIGISISRRIDRPGYSQLNPFLFLIDVTTYATGRPGLLPQLTWSYELSYTVKSLSFTLGYSHTKDNQNIAIAKFRDVFPSIPSDENVTVQIPINLSSSDYFGLTASAPIRIKKWWNMINNLNVYYNHFNGQLGGTTLNNGKPSADFRTNNTFTFGKGWTAELNGSVNSGGQYGFMVLDPQWALGTGIQKIMMKGKGTLRFNITDIFWTNLPKAVITYNNYIEKWHAYRETRVANLTFTYRFGNNKVQAARRRTTASEEERQRAGQ
ncbi:MAG TPA: outer membrane beta-barrel protein [Chitinophagaceae bacterium]|nr:outer membrane beta-barrel protein [Chitinophagaceae bacterium]